VIEPLQKRSNKLWSSEAEKHHKINEIIDHLNKQEPKCEHEWEYSSPPHRDQRCIKCHEHRIEPSAPDVEELARTISNTIHNGQMPCEICKIVAQDILSKYNMRKK
jgi:hypothetical protein